jgi:GNAT superfamily N-acetyltransferase
MTLSLRAGTPDDAHSCGPICHEAFNGIAGAHGFPPDFPSPDVAVGLLSELFARDDVYSVVAEVDGRVVGSNFLWESDGIAGVGPITVDPAAQGLVGRRLMEDVLRRADERRFAGVRLVQAAYNSKSLSLYTKLGFDVREPLAVMQGPRVKADVPSYVVRAAREDDLADCGEVCARVHGHGRTGELGASIEQGTATVVEWGGRIVGYATVIGYFGHAVADSNEGLKALIAGAPEYVGPGFLLPMRNGELFRWCLGNGLRVVQPLTLMSKGLYTEPAGAFLPSILF